MQTPGGKDHLFEYLVSHPGSQFFASRARIDQQEKDIRELERKIEERDVRITSLLREMGDRQRRLAIYEPELPIPDSVEPIPITRQPSHAYLPHLSQLYSNLTRIASERANEEEKGQAWRDIRPFARQLARRLAITPDSLIAAWQPTLLLDSVRERMIRYEDNVAAADTTVPASAVLLGAGAEEDSKILSFLRKKPETDRSERVASIMAAYLNKRLTFEHAHIVVEALLTSLAHRATSNDLPGVKYTNYEPRSRIVMTSSLSADGGGNIDSTCIGILEATVSGLGRDGLATRVDSVWGIILVKAEEGQFASYAFAFFPGDPHIEEWPKWWVFGQDQDLALELGQVSQSPMLRS
jgi:hypothetical protein